MKRVNEIKRIQKKLPDLNDEAIDYIYEKVCLSFDGNICEIYKRPQKTEYINKNIVNVSNQDIKEIKIKVNEELEIIQKIEKKCKILLEILNDIIGTFNDDCGQIDDPVSFRDIKKEKIVTEDVINVMSNKYEYIFENGFSKTTCRYHDSMRLKYGHLTILKGMCRELGYKIVSKQKILTKNGVRSTDVYYSIVHD